MNRVDQIIKENAWRQIGASAIVQGKYVPEQKQHVLLEKERYYHGKLVAKREIRKETKIGKSFHITVYDMETETTVMHLGQPLTQTFIIENIPWNKLEPGGD